MKSFGYPSSTELADAISTADFSGRTASIVGYGNMGKQYAGLSGCERTSITDKGFELLEWQPGPDELVIIALPIEKLKPAALHLAALGYRNMLIEKPVSLRSVEISNLAEELTRYGVNAVCAYNRMAYPSLCEVRARVAEEGGATSCTYGLTEILQPDWPNRFSSDVLARWGIANSLHVISMVYGLTGMPENYECHQGGGLDWHRSGSVFVGTGNTDMGVPFSYHADWEAPDRWWIEVYTRASAYRLCPLESLYRRTSPTGDWTGVEISTFDQNVKAGILEQVAAMLDPGVGEKLTLSSLSTAAALTRYAENVFGYGSN